jgi:hypothetical protein
MEIVVVSKVANNDVKGRSLLVRDRDVLTLLKKHGFNQETIRMIK